MVVPIKLFFRNKSALFGILILVNIVLFTFAGSMLTPYGETEVFRETKQGMYVNALFEPPSLKHPLGTDKNGMDILTRLMYGGRISLLIGFRVVIIEIIIGVIVGGTAGFFGKWIDSLLMRLVDVIHCIPAIPIYIILGSVIEYYKLDNRIRIYMLCIVLGLLSWPSVARMVRGQILFLREQEFMIAAKATGIKTFHRIFRHLIPNVFPQILILAALDFGNAILLEATLSCVGFGVRYPYASWGNMLNAITDIYVMTKYWFTWVPAGMLILFTVLGIHLVSDGLRDAFNPKMKYAGEKGYTWKNTSPS